MSARRKHPPLPGAQLPAWMGGKTAAWTAHHTHAGVSLLLIVCTALLYLRTTGYPLQFDDLVYLRGNPLVSSTQTLERYTHARAFVKSTRTAGLEPDLARSFMLRPVTYVTFHLNYAFDGFNPHWYRMFNIALHAANSLLVYALLLLLLRHIDNSHRLDCRIAAATALLFAVHPLATESVTFITQRFTSLAAFFYLLTLILHFTAHGARMPNLWQTAAVASLVLGMLSKECTVTAPIVVMLLHRYVFCRSWKESTRRAGPLLLCLPLVPALVLFAAWAHSDGLTLGAAIELANTRDAPISHKHYLLTGFTVMMGYLRSIFWPNELNIDPEWPLYRSLFNWQVLASISVITTLIAGTWWWQKRRSDALAGSVHVFTCWFFITVFVSSGLVPLGDVMAEHRAYLPSIGVFAVVALLLHQITSPHPWLHGCMVAVCAIALACTTWLRNEVWSSTISLWADAVAKSPGKYRAWGNLGTAYGEHGIIDEALRCYRKARDLEPRYETAYLNAATLLNGEHRYQDAFNECVELMHHSPQSASNPEVHHLMALAEIGAGKLSAGMDRLEQITKTFPYYRPALVLLGLVHRRLDQPKEALRCWQEALHLQPCDPQLNQPVRETGESISQAQSEP